MYVCAFPFKCTIFILYGYYMIFFLKDIIDNEWIYPNYEEENNNADIYECNAKKNK